MTDSPLTRVAAGDETAVSECLTRYGGLVWSLALRFCASKEDAEDAAQEIFLELWSKADRFDPSRASDVTFVSMLARRRLIDRYRRALRGPEAQPLDSEIPIQNDPTLAVELVDEAAKAREELGKLSSEQRRSIELFVYQGLSHGAVAQEMDLPLGTVKTHIRRGLMRIREALFVEKRPIAVRGGER